MSNGGSRAPSIVNAAGILRFVSESGRPQSVAAIVQGTNVPRSSVVGICQALSDERMLTRGLDGTYWLGPHTAELAAAARRGSPTGLRFGLLIPTMHNPYFTATLAAAREEVAAVRGELHMLAAEEDFVVQRRQWGELLDMGIDALLVDGVATQGFEDCLERAKRLQIPVIAIGSRMHGVNASVTSDNTQAGLLAGHYLAGRLKPGARVAIVDGLHKSANVDRVAGFLEAIRDHPGIEVAAHLSGAKDNRDSGRGVAKQLFSAHPDLTGLFAVCDPVALGVADYSRDTGRTVPIVSVDGRAEAVDQISHGGPIVASSAQDPLRIARTGTRLAIELCNGNRAAQGAILTPVRLITPENAKDYAAWG